MDSTGLIQLIIATILYSTLIAPNIKQMNDIRSEISDIQFPLKSDTSYETESKTIGTKINKKIKQYVAVYENKKISTLFIFSNRRSFL